MQFDIEKHLGGLTARERAERDRHISLTDRGVQCSWPGEV